MSDVLNEMEVKQDHGNFTSKKEKKASDVYHEETNEDKKFETGGDAEL